MTALGDIARSTGVSRAAAASADELAAWNSIGAAIDALPTGGGGSLTWPTGVDCIGGTAATAPSIPAGDTDSGAVNLTYYDRMLDSMPNGAIPFFGHSLIQGMAVCEASPFGLNLGYGGESMRRLIVRMLRASSVAAMQRAGAVVLHTGVVDFSNTGIYGAMTTLAAAATVAGMYANRLKPWMTGKWVIVAPVRGGSGIPAGYNASCDAVLNGGVTGGTPFAGLTSIFSGMSNVRIVNPNVSPMIDGSGNLATANHIGDHQHFSKAGNSILAGLIRTELEALGVGG